MSRFLLFLLVLFAATAVMGDALYKWVDDQGNVHYSDKPHPGAVKVQLPNAQTYAAPAESAPTNNENAHGAKQRPASSYSQLSIGSPADQATLWNVHSVTVSVDLVPALQSGDTITISVDGQSKTGTAMSQTFEDLDRGQHSAAASVTSRGSKAIVAVPVTFFIQDSTKK